MQITTKFSIGDYVYPVRSKGIICPTYYVKCKYKIHCIRVQKQHHRMETYYYLGKYKKEHEEENLFIDKQQALRYRDYRNEYSKRLWIICKRSGDITQAQLQDINDKYKDIIKH